MLATPPILVSSDDHATPTINIWHDEDEVVRWTPVDDSFGKGGADGLWRDRPSARDILDATAWGRDDGGGRDIVLLHAILESGRDPAGNGHDASPLLDESLMARVRAASVEPVVFPDVETGVVSREDADAAISLVDRVEASLFSDPPRVSVDDDDRLLVISPDRPCHDALVSRRAEHRRRRRTREDDDDDDDDDEDDHDARGRRRRVEYAVRDGARGSVVDGASFPPATLIVPDNDDDGRRRINPTGAGNAYAGAYAACRATGSDVAEAACIANAVGAVVCECDHLPPWTWEAIDRIVEAASEVEGKIDMGDGGGGGGVD
ncbi:hypothetical protein ACHAW5_003972 [Stephanodiscus triporus]|uniref:Carbohydrate kinase PfkB domain-containing protein n=1 Tax=Stephanodiscus triporus TaxID=2934178 RepID=A0ABD3N421_9STRA